MKSKSKVAIIVYQCIQSIFMQAFCSYKRIVSFIASVTCHSPSRRSLQAVHWCSVFARGEELLVQVRVAEGQLHITTCCCQNANWLPYISLQADIYPEDDLSIFLSFLEPFTSFYWFFLQSVFKEHHYLSCLHSCSFSCPQVAASCWVLTDFSVGFLCTVSQKWNLEVQIWELFDSHVRVFRRHEYLPCGQAWYIFWPILMIPEYKAVAIAAVWSQCPGLGSGACRYYLRIGSAVLLPYARMRRIQFACFLVRCCERKFCYLSAELTEGSKESCSEAACGLQVEAVPSSNMPVWLSIVCES